MEDLGANLDYEGNTGIMRGSAVVNTCAPYYTTFI